jgi:hypothetical protein
MLFLKYYIPFGHYYNIYKYVLSCRLLLLLASREKDLRSRASWIPK